MKGIEGRRYLYKANGQSMHGRTILHTSWRINYLVLIYISLYERASFVGKEKYGRRWILYQHNSIQLEQCVAVVEEGGCVVYEVFGLARVEQGGLWFVGKRMLRTMGGMSCSRSSVEVRELGSAVRRVGIVHSCDDGCSFTRKTRKARHSQSVCDGGCTMY